MQPHPDFAGVSIPRRANVGQCQLTPLHMPVAEEDFDVVTTSAGVLKGIFGSWPDGLSLDENRIDLAWHDREFTLGRSFSWVIRDMGEVYLGCLYLFPAPGGRGQAEAVAWLKDHPDRNALADVIFQQLADWMAEHVPEQVEVAWTCSPNRPPRASE